MEVSDQTSGIPLITVPRQTGMAAADIQRQKVMLAMPFYKSTNPLTMFSLMQLYDKRRMAIAMNFGDAFVAHSRSACVDAFLASDMDWIFFADDDMIYPCGNAKWFNGVTEFGLPDAAAGMHAIDRLLASGKSLVGGTYWGRHKYGKAMYAEGCNVPAEAEYARKGPHNVVKPTRWVATGCMLISRIVFLDIERKFPRLGRQVGGKGNHFFSSTEHNIMDLVDRTRAMLSEGTMTGDKALKAYEMLESGVAEAKKESSLGMGEDVAFCRRASAAGHQPHVDLGLICGHVSSSAIYGPRNTLPKK